MGSFTPPPTTSLTPGDHLDRYELLCILAQGGMGTVWLARMSGKLGFERLVALKTILPAYSGDRQFSDMFLDEARIAAQIDHENVARILEIGEDRGLLYYAMELIDGESLRKLYRDVRAKGAVFPLGIALRIIADACAGLHATHELRNDDGEPLQVVHRDVSPQNLLVSIRGTTKLIDFGVAKANARRSEATAVGTLKGKIEYMAPEQARGEALDRRADVYSLGAVLYELLCGRPVRDTDEGKQLAALHELMTGVPIAPIPETVPQVVQSVVQRALARDPRERFGSTDELRHALEQAMLAIGQVASYDDVANVLAQFSRERTAKRKDAIDRALRAATEGRLNAATIVSPLSSRGGASQGSAPGSMTGSGSASGPGSVASVFTPEALGSVSSMGARHGPTSLPMVPSVAPSGHGLDGPTTGPSMRTIGPASFTAQPRSGTSAAKIVAGVLLLGGVAVAGVVAGVVATRRAQHDRPVVATSIAASSALGASAREGSDPLPPALVIEPAASSSSEAAMRSAARDAGAPQASARRPQQKLPGKPGIKQGDGDEYGF